MPDDTDIEPVDPDAPPPIYQTIGLAAEADDDDSDENVAEALEAARHGRYCKRCGKAITDGSKKLYHPDCRPGATHSGMTEPEGPAQTAGPAPSKPAAKPTTKAGKAAQLEAVERNTRTLLEQFVAPMLMMAAQAQQSATLQADALDVNNGAPAIATATRNLAEHEDWLRKMLAGGQQSERALAWMAFAFTVGPVILPILVRHKVIPDALAAGIPGVTPQPVAV